ncbi:MAG: Xaa-Pro peptidase family protein [Candidatus Methanospirare jalkutatii]|nr:Xaa-Pro peptidase family protein [Candidatus Methanospirare jalkutatii]
MKGMSEAKPLLLFSESMHNADMFYATRFLSADPFIYLRTETKEIILVAEMEVERAKREAKVKDVHSLLEYGDIGAEIEDIIVELLREEGISAVKVPKYFPVSIADALRNQGISVEVVEEVFKGREVKSWWEVELIKKAQRACEYAMRTALNIIKSCSVRNGVLIDSKGEPLTAEKVKICIEHALIERECTTEEPIVACGMGGANPHWTGSGEIRADEPLILDIFPRLRRERYFADMTRTVVRGEPASEVVEMFEAVLDAQNAAISLVREGVSCAEVHNCVCDIFEERGYETLRKQQQEKMQKESEEMQKESKEKMRKHSERHFRAKEQRKGFLHLTGHGVGLSLHEKPSLGFNEDLLRRGNVVTIEPGLYDPAFGGVRIEDLVVVLRNGCENLTKFEKRLVL